MLVADLAGFLGQSSELFRLISGPLPQIFVHGPGVFGLSGIVRHIVPLLGVMIVRPPASLRLSLSGHVRSAAACHASRMEQRSAGTIMTYSRGETIFTQGDACDDVLCIRTGGVKLSVLSKTGHEAAVATLGPGDFFGEGCLAGLENRTGSATAITPSVIVIIGKEKMARLLHSQHSMSDRFISHMLSRQIGMEEALVDQFFNTSEQRLAGTLLLLAGYGKRDKPATGRAGDFAGHAR